MGSRTGAAAQVKSLAKAISIAFASSALTEEEKNPGKIDLMDLPWQAPPLITSSMLCGAPLQDYLDVPMRIEEDRLHEFWRQTLDHIRSQPTRLMRNGALTNCGWAMPNLKIGQRALRFTKPAGYPSADETAGVMFSLEVAHAARTSLVVADLVSDDNNYYVTLRDGMVLGVRDGRPACNCDWPFDASGMVQEMLTMPRGDTSYVCQFDQIAALRSVLFVHQDRFPHNFDALDLALQALRLVSLGGWCPELVHQMYVAPVDISVTRSLEYALRDAIETISADMSDRSKLLVLHNLLVPSVVTATQFKKHVFSGAQYPSYLAPGKLLIIDTWLRQEYETRIPAGMRQLKEQA